MQGSIGVEWIGVIMCSIIDLPSYYYLGYLCLCVLVLVFIVRSVRCA